MHPYRFKVPTFFLGCLLFVAIVNAIGGQRLRTRIDHFPVAPAVAPSPSETFGAKLSATSDPAELRAIALERYRVALAADRVLDSLPTFFKALKRSLLIQGWGILILVVCFYLFEYRTPR